MIGALQINFENAQKKCTMVAGRPVYDGHRKAVGKLEMRRKWTTALFGLFFLLYPTGLPVSQTQVAGPHSEIRNLEGPYVVDLVAKLEPR